MFQDDTSDQKIVEDEDGGITIESGGEAGPPIRLDPGRYAVRCQLEGSHPHTTPLLVKPARGVALPTDTV